jgi:hypothetical protein
VPSATRLATTGRSAPDEPRSLIGVALLLANRPPAPWP